jgi:hypothetical protein
MSTIARREARLFRQRVTRRCVQLRVALGDKSILCEIADFCRRETERGRARALRNCAAG